MSKPKKLQGMLACFTKILLCCGICLPVQIYAQQYFKADADYGERYGVRVADTLDSGLILFKRAVRKEVMEVVSKDEKRNQNPNEKVFYAYQYNFGARKGDFKLVDWVFGVEELNSEVYLVKADDYALYNSDGKLLHDLKNEEEPLRLENLLVCRVGEYLPNYLLDSEVTENRKFQYLILDLNQQARVLFQDSISDVRLIEGQLMLLYKDNPIKNKLLDKSLSSLLPADLAPLLYLGGMVAVVDVNTLKTGLIELNGHDVIVPVSFDYISLVGVPMHSLADPDIPFEELRVFLEPKLKYFEGVRNDSSYLYNRKAQQIYSGLACNYSLVERKGREIYIKISRDDKVGILDSTGKEIVPAAFENVFFSSKYIIASKRYDQDYVYSYNGKALFNGPYKRIKELGPNLLVLTKEASISGSNQITLVHLDGFKVLNKIPYDKYDDIQESMIPFNRGDTYFFLDMNGVELFSIKADYLSGFENGLCTVYKGKKSGVINTKGEWVKPMKRR